MNSEKRIAFMEKLLVATKEKKYHGVGLICILK